MRKTFAAFSRELRCRLTGHKWGKLSLNRRTQKCSRCPATRTLTPAEGRKIADLQFLGGSKWTPEEIERAKRSPKA